VQWLVGSGYDTSAFEVPIQTARGHYLRTTGYDTLDLAVVGIGEGVGGEVWLAYAFTPRLALRLGASAIRHRSAIGTVGAAWTVLDVVLGQPLGERFDLDAFARLGKLAVTIDGADIDRNAATGPRNWAIAGWLVGGGVGLRCWMTSHLSVNGDASAVAVWNTDLIRSDGTGIAARLRKRGKGATLGVSVALEYHW